MRTELDDPEFPTREVGPDLVLSSRPRWTLAMLFGVLGIMHLTVWTISILHRHYEAYLSLFFGLAFSMIAVALRCMRREIVVVPAGRFIRISYRVWHFQSSRTIDFAKVDSVRLTITNDGPVPEELIEIICTDEVIECPPTQVPRQEALCLAMLTGVRLIKATDELAARSMPEE